MTMDMKLYLRIMAAILLGSPLGWAQEARIVAGASAVYNLPMGALHSRFEGSFGGMIYAGKQISSDWTWTGKLEYFELTTLNTSKLIKTVKIQEAGGTQQYQIPLSKLSMSMKAAGLTAEAILNLARFTSAETNAHIGFGFYNWDNYRGPYTDSLFVQSRVSGSTIKVANLAVPENRQTDWSGSFNVGVDVNITVVDPVLVTFGAEYRLIVGELWQALDLDLENVSGMQFIAFRVGIKAEF